MITRRSIPGGALDVWVFHSIRGAVDCIHHRNGDGLLWCSVYYHCDVSSMNLFASRINFLNMDVLGIHIVPTAIQIKPPRSPKCSISYGTFPGFIFRARALVLILLYRQEIGMTFAFYAIVLGQAIGGYHLLFVFFACVGSILAFIPILFLMWKGEAIRAAERAAERPV